MLSLILIVGLLFLGLGYLFYGRFLDRRFDVDDKRQTPAHTDYDGVDRVPARAIMLFGHHFSSIAGAGPVVGVITAAVAFGWFPTLLWILIGSVFIGGVHDYASMMVSIRHRARSVAEIARETMSPLAYRLFLVFLWLALVYVLVVFLDLTSTTFVEDPGVATASLFYIFLAMCFGVIVYRFKMRVLWASLIFVPLVFAGIALGEWLPIELSAPLAKASLPWAPAKVWNVVLLLYMLLASTLPVWFLLQPRDYLSSFLLYSSLAAGCFGVLAGGWLGNLTIQAPWINAWNDASLGTLFPAMFITVACGACSGFHSIIASGTSSKQLDRETDAKKVAYGAMLVEALVGVISVAIVAMYLPADLKGKNPLTIYGDGIATFLGLFGVPVSVGGSFALLALSTFILTSLDTATRVSRYVFEEFFNIKGPVHRYIATLVSLILPAIFVMIDLHDPNGLPMPAWKVLWPVFGATNQLMAGLALLVITVWLRKNAKPIIFTLLPMIFMICMTVYSLVQLVLRYHYSLIGWISVILLALAVIVIFEAIRTLSRKTIPGTT